MKILVPVKRVVDANIKVKVGPDGKLDVANLKHSMNPFDEIALEQAVQMKEKGIANEVIAVSVGDTKAQETLRTALAMGADKGVLIQTDKPFEAEPLNVAKLISAYVKQVNPDLIICGKQAVDNDSNQVGQMIAAMCEYPQATHASSALMKEGKLEVTREIDGGYEVLDLTLPAVVTADLRLNAPRYVTLPMMMKAKRKPQEVVMASALCRISVRTLKLSAMKPLKHARSAARLPMSTNSSTNSRTKRRYFKEREHGRFSYCRT